MKCDPCEENQPIEGETGQLPIYSLIGNICIALLLMQTGVNDAKPNAYLRLTLSTHASAHLRGIKIVYGNKTLSRLVSLYCQRNGYVFYDTNQNTSSRGGGAVKSRAGSRAQVATTGLRMRRVNKQGLAPCKCRAAR